MRQALDALEIVPEEQWAERVAGELAARLRSDPGLRLCLPTGDTPTPLYDALVAAAARGEAGFGEATVVLLDEYVGLPPDDPARCDARLKRELIDRLDPPPRFHPILVDELTPEEAAADLDAVAGAGLDLTLLGLGANGHVGMNEPGSTAESPTRVVHLAGPTRDAATGYGAASAPSAGITLGMDRILGSGEVWLLVTGERKAEILERTLLGAESADVPASFLRRLPGLRVFADEPAATRLDRPRSGGSGRDVRR